MADDSFQSVINEKGQNVMKLPLLHEDPKFSYLQYCAPVQVAASSLTPLPTQLRLRLHTECRRMDAQALSQADQRLASDGNRDDSARPVRLIRNRKVITQGLTDSIRQTYLTYYCHYLLTHH